MRTEKLTRRPHTAIKNSRCPRFGLHRILSLCVSPINALLKGRTVRTNPIPMSLRKIFLRSVGVSLLAAFALSALSAAPWKFAVLGDGRTGGENGNTTGVNDVAARAIAAELVKEKVSLAI